MGNKVKLFKYKCIIKVYRTLNKKQRGKKVIGHK